MDTTIFIDLSPYWEQLLIIGEERLHQKSGYISHKPHSKFNPDFVGVCGEKIFEIWTGLPIDTILRQEGDRGWDFIYKPPHYHRAIKYDVKTSTYNPPDLMEYIEQNGTKPKTKSDCYVLCFLEPFKKRGMIVGWASQQQLFTSQKYYNRKGWRWAIEYHRFSEWGQVGLPPTMTELAKCLRGVTVSTTDF